MRNRTWATLCGLFAASTAWGLDEQAALQEFQQAFPEVQLYRTGSRITTVYAAPFGFGDSPEQTAAAFVASYAEMLGADPADLEPLSRLDDWRHTQPLMHEPELGSYRFTLVYFSQFRDGLPVFRADVRLLVRNDPGSPLVLARSSLRNLGDFRPGPIPAVRYDRMEDAALEAFPELVNLTDPELVIWAGTGTVVAEPTLAVRFVADNGMPGTADYQKWLFLADAGTGEVLHRENQIQNFDEITGTVRGRVTAQHDARLCGQFADTPLPFVKVTVGFTPYFADVNGNYVIPHPSGPVTIASRIFGRWFFVANADGPNAVLLEDGHPPNIVDFLHNAGEAEVTTAEVNAYVEAHDARNLVLAANPDFPTIGGDDPETQFLIDINVAGSCGGQYTGASISFFRKGGECSNAAFGAIVHHEYGHHVVAKGIPGIGTEQGEYGEGMGDAIAVLISGEPELAKGEHFPPNCDFFGRNAANDCVFVAAGCSECPTGPCPECTNEIHLCGQLLSGCVWDTRAKLEQAGVPLWEDIIRDLTINSIPLHADKTITYQIMIDFATLDDDNADIRDGTPNFDAIYCGFGAHKMLAPGFRRGDMNCDGAVNGADTIPFFDALADPVAWQAANPLCNVINADVNGDGLVNGGDIGPYFTCLGGGNCCPSCIRTCIF